MPNPLQIKKYYLNIDKIDKDSKYEVNTVTLTAHTELSCFVYNILSNLRAGRHPLFIYMFVFYVGVWVIFLGIK